MAVLMVIYTVCATRTNIVYVVIFTALIVLFALLAAAYWRLGQGDVVVGNRLTVVSSAIFADSPCVSPGVFFFIDVSIPRALVLLYSWLLC